MTKSFTSGLVLGLVFLFVDSAEAQIQVRDQWDGYVQLAGRFISSDTRFTPAGETQETAQVDISTVQLYAELGLIDRWLMASLEGDLYRRTGVSNEVLGLGGATSGLGDLRLGLFTTIFQGPVNVLGSVKLGIPTGDARPNAGLPETNPDGTPNDENAILNDFAELSPTGDGEFDVEFGVTVARAFELPGLPFRSFGRAFGAFWLRTGTDSPLGGGDGDFSNAVNYDFQLGLQGKAPILRRIWFIGAVRGSESFADLENGGQVSVGLGNGVSYTDLSGQIQARLPAGFGLLAEVSTPLRGTLVLDAPSFGIGASYRF